MSNYTGIERLLGLPEGSTEQADKDIQQLLARGVQQKTTQLEKQVNKIDTLDNMATSELVKCGISVEKLEMDKVIIRNEAFEVYRIAKALLERYKQQVDGLIDVNDRMWASGGKMIEAVVGSLDRLTTMILKFKQEEEMKALTMVKDNDDGSKEMSATDWISFIKEVKNSEIEGIEGEVIDNDK